MNGTNATTGKRLADLDHLRQSIHDILSTPIGSRVMRREYGSRLFDLIDAPINRSTVADIYAATAEALTKWEPRFLVTNVKATQTAPGVLELDVTGQYLPDGRVITLEGIQVK